jgi:hypothetical protein
MKDKKAEQSALEANLPVIVNAVELVSQVVAQVAGNAISNMIDGKIVTPTVLQGTVAARLQSILNSQTGAR